MDTEKIILLHPEGKHGVRIENSKYIQVRQAILSVLQKHGKMGFTAALKQVEAVLEGKFDGSVSWYYVSVKMHMETLGEIVSSIEKGRQMIELKA